MTKDQFEYIEIRIWLGDEKGQDKSNRLEQYTFFCFIPPRYRSQYKF